MFVELFHGYVRVMLCGDNLIRLIQLWKNKDIPIWNLSKTNQGYECSMYAADLRRSRNLLKKTGSRFHVRKRKGLPFFLFRNRFRILSYLWAFSSFLILSFMNQYVWNLDFQGNVKYSDQLLSQYCESKGYGLGMKLSDVDGEQLEWDIRTQYPDITWVSVEVKGTKVTVNIKENDGYLEKEEKNLEASSLCAEHSGVIRNIVTRKGVPMVSVGDSVEEGQVLISGEIPVFSDSGEVSSYHYICADGDVELEYSIEENIAIPRRYVKRVYTGERVLPYIEMLGHMFSFYPGADTNKTEISVTRQQWQLKESFYMPIYSGEVSIKSYVEIDAIYTDEEMEAELQNQIHLRIVELEKTGVQIIENRVTMKNNTTQGLASGSILVSKVQKRYKKIEQTKGE